MPTPQALRLCSVSVSKCCRSAHLKQIGIAFRDQAYLPHCHSKLALVIQSLLGVLVSSLVASLVLVAVISGYLASEYAIIFLSGIKSARILHCS